ncbi:AraC family transcriptional regulator, partial [Mesorhizobium sp. M7A.F.Ca.CA.004.11.1.1]
PLAQIAVEAGFSDQSHFTRQFKKAFGMTPGRWSSLIQGSAAAA